MNNKKIRISLIRQGISQKGADSIIELFEKKEEEIIDVEIKDCQTLIKLTEKKILNAKNHKDYKFLLTNMQDVLERKYAIFRLEKLKSRLVGD